MSQALVLLLLLLSPLYAQDEETLEPIKVSADKVVSDFSFSKPETVSKEELEAEPTGLIAPKLAELPGIISSQSGGPGSRISFFIRGTEARHVSFTIDGLKVNDPSNVDRQFDTAFLPSPFLSQLQVHKGPQAVLYGSDALGGLVEMTTRKGEDAPETRFDFTAGSFGTVSSSLATDWRTGEEKKHSGSLTLYTFRTDGISRLNERRFDAKERDGSSSTQLASSSTHELGEKVRTDLLFSVLRGRNELDGNADDNSNDKSLNDQYLVQQKTNLRLSEASALSLRTGLNRHQRVIDNEFLGVNSVLSYQGNLIQQEALYKYETKTFNAIGGISSEHEELSGDGVDRSFDLHSVFLQSAFKLSAVRFYGGGRAERHVRYGSFYTGSTGAAYLLGNHRVFAQYSQGFKAPSLYQLYGPSFPGFPVGNDRLTPELNHSWEGGWSFDQKKLSGRVTLFQNRLSNLITYTAPLGYFNQRRFIAEGIELSGKYRERAYQFTSSFTHQRFRKEESPVIGRPLNALQVGVTVFPSESAEVSVKGRWFSSRQGINNLEPIKLNGHEVVDLGFRYLFTSVDVGVQILNIFDRKYEELFGYSVMPRSVFFNTGYRF